MNELDGFLTLDRVALGFPAKDKPGLLRDLAAMAAGAVGGDAATILSALEQREQLGTTGIGDGVAIPHGRVPGIARMTGFFVRLAAPLEYDALDDAPVDLVFLLLAPEDAGPAKLKALARVARILRDPEIGPRLRTEAKPEQVFELLQGRVPGKER